MSVIRPVLKTKLNDQDKGGLFASEIGFISHKKLFSILDISLCVTRHQGTNTDLRKKERS